MTPKGHIALAISAFIGTMGLVLLVILMGMDKSSLEGYQIMISVMVVVACLWMAAAMAIMAFDDAMKEK